jgi:hypothetical protein
MLWGIMLARFSGNFVRCSYLDVAPGTFFIKMPVPVAATRNVIIEANATLVELNLYKLVNVHLYKIAIPLYI